MFIELIVFGAYKFSKLDFASKQRQVLKFLLVMEHIVEISTIKI